MMGTWIPLQIYVEIMNVMPGAWRMNEFIVVML